MDESRRKRKSFWDVEEENRNNSWTQKEQYSTDDNWHLSPSQADNSLKPKDQSRRSSLETHRVAEKIENAYNDGRDASQIKEHCRDYSHYKSMSPGFDGWVQRKHNRSPEDTLGQTHRFVTMHLCSSEKSLESLFSLFFVMQYIDEYITTMNNCGIMASFIFFCMLTTQSWHSEAHIYLLWTIEAS